MMWYSQPLSGALDSRHDCDRCDRVCDSFPDRSLRPQKVPSMTRSAVYDGSPHKLALDYSTERNAGFLPNESIRKRVKYTIHFESKNKTTNTCPQLHQMLTDFQTFLTDGLGSKFATNSCLNIPPRITLVATLPCAIWMSEKMASIWNTYCN